MVKVAVHSKNPVTDEMLQQFNNSFDKFAVVQDSCEDGYYGFAVEAESTEENKVSALRLAEDNEEVTVEITSVPVVWNEVVDEEALRDVVSSNEIYRSIDITGQSVQEFVNKVSEAAMLSGAVTASKLTSSPDKEFKKALKASGYGSDPVYAYLDYALGL